MTKIARCSKASDRDKSHISCMEDTLQCCEGQRPTPKASTMSTASVPDWLRNESGVDVKPRTGKKRRKDTVHDMLMKILEESHKNRQELYNQLLSSCDAIVSKLPSVDKSEVLVDKSKGLFEEYRMIRDEEKEITMDASMDADTKAAFLELLNHRREAVTREVVAYNDEKKRKASEMSGTSS
jgi:hypothetical protein